MLGRMPRWVRWAAIILAALVVLAVTEIRATILPIQIASECQYQDRAGDEKCAAYDVLLVAVAKVSEIFEANSGTISALATVAIAAFTWTLWRSTNRLWEATGRTADISDNAAKRQLRAYVSVIDAKIYNANSEWMPQLEVKYKNFGRTPAYRVAHHMRFYFGKNRRGPVPGIPRRPVAVIDLGPGQDSHTSCHITLAEWADRKPALDAGKEWLFVYGFIEYEDAFGGKRTTRYRFRDMPDNEGITDGGLYLCEEGNDSD